MLPANFLFLQLRKHFFCNKMCLEQWFEIEWSILVRKNVSTHRTFDPIFQRVDKVSLRFVSSLLKTHKSS